MLLDFQQSQLPTGTLKSIHSYIGVPTTPREERHAKSPFKNVAMYLSIYLSLLPALVVFLKGSRDKMHISTQVIIYVWESISSNELDMHWMFFFVGGERCTECVCSTRTVINSVSANSKWKASSASSKVSWVEPTQNFSFHNLRFV